MSKKAESEFVDEDLSSEIVRVRDVVGSVQPKSLHKALQRPDAELYQRAYDEELAALREADVFTVVPRTSVPQGHRVLVPLVVFAAKYQGDQFERIKARIVVDGSRQESGVDFGATYAPVAATTTFRMLCAVAVHKSWVVHQLDIKT